MSFENFTGTYKDGILTYESFNWTGKAIFTKRVNLSKLQHVFQAHQPGVYILVGSHLNQKVVYIGEADSIFNRLVQHSKAKDFWEEALFFVSKDNNLTKGHIRFLESLLIQRVKKIGSVILTNTSCPKAPPVGEQDKKHMEYFLEQIKCFAEIFRYDFLVSKTVAVFAQYEVPLKKLSDEEVFNQLEKCSDWRVKPV